MTRPLAGTSEDWLAVIVGLILFVLSLGTLAGLDLLGFAAAPKTWIDLGSAIKPASEVYASLGGVASLILTYLFVLVLMLPAAAALGVNLPRFAASFSVIFWLAYLCWILGNHAYVAVTTPAEMEKFGISWSLRLTGESGYLIALLVGLFIANSHVSPARCARRRDRSCSSRSPSSFSAARSPVSTCSASPRRLRPGSISGRP